MRRKELFWAVILIVVGVLLILDRLVGLAFGQLILPVSLILVGIWVLWGARRGREAIEREEVSIPIEDAERASVRLRHGAGRLRINAGAGPDELMAGSFRGGVNCQVERRGDTMDLGIGPPRGELSPFFRPWFWGRGGMDWEVRLNGEIPLSLRVDTGAASAELELSQLRVTDLELHTGVSSSQIELPARAGHTRVRIESGMASVSVRVPADVAARIRSESGLASVAVDTARFRRVGNVYESPDYDVAENKVDIHVKAGLGSVDIR